MPSQPESKPRSAELQRSKPKAINRGELNPGRSFRGSRYGKTLVPGMHYGTAIHHQDRSRAPRSLRPCWNFARAEELQFASLVSAVGSVRDVEFTGIQAGAHLPMTEARFKTIRLGGPSWIDGPGRQHRFKAPRNSSPGSSISSPPNPAATWWADAWWKRRSSPPAKSFWPSTWCRALSSTTPPPAGWIPFTSRNSGEHSRSASNRDCVDRCSTCRATCRACCKTFRSSKPMAS